MQLHLWNSTRNSYRQPQSWRSWLVKSNRWARCCLDSRRCCSCFCPSVRPVRWCRMSRSFEGSGLRDRPSKSGISLPGPNYRNQTGFIAGSCHWSGRLHRKIWWRLCSGGCSVMFRSEWNPWWSSRCLRSESESCHELGQGRKHQTQEGMRQFHWARQLSTISALRLSWLARCKLHRWNQARLE